MLSQNKRTNLNKDHLPTRYEKINRITRIKSQIFIHT